MRRMRQIFNVLLHKNSSPNMLNENMRIKIIGGMKLGALGENAKLQYAH